MNVGNLEYHQSVAESHPNLLLKFAYLKNLDDIDLFNIRRLHRGKESDQGKVGVYVTTLITYKNTFVANIRLMKISLVIG